MIEASPSRGTPEQWTAEQAARAMGVVDEADGEALGVDGAASGEIGMAGAVGREEPSARSGMRWVAGGAALGVVAAAAWWSGAGNRDSREIPVHEGTYGALIAGEHTLNSGPGDINTSNGRSHMKIQTTAAAALLGAAASAFQAQAGDAVQWRVEDGGNGHWYRAVDAATGDSAIVLAASLGGNLATIATAGENAVVKQVFLATGKQYAWLGLLQASGQATPGAGWYWVTGEPLKYLNWTDHNGAFPTSAPDDSPCALPPWGVENDQANQGVMDPTGRWDDLENGMPTCGSPVWNNAAIVEWSADCNSDGIVDYGQILNGQLADNNTNGIPDCCEPGNNCCVGDIYLNHIIDGGDLGVLLSEWGVVTPTTRSDLNRDGFVDGADLGRLLANWGPCGG